MCARAAASKTCLFIVIPNYFSSIFSSLSLLLIFFHITFLFFTISFKLLSQVRLYYNFPIFLPIPSLLHPRVFRNFLNMISRFLLNMFTVILSIISLTLHRSFTLPSPLLLPADQVLLASQTRIMKWKTHDFRRSGRFPSVCIQPGPRCPPCC